MEQLLKKISEDLCISKFQNETNLQYQNRVLYSALACWIKTIATDKPVGRTSSEGVSKKYILDKSSEVMVGFLNTFPDSVPYFFDEEAECTPMQLIRTRLIKNTDLIVTGFDTNLGLSAYNSVPITDSIEWCKGVLLDRNAEYIGVSTVKKGTFEIDESMVKSSDWFRTYVDSVKWNPMKTDEEFECFDATFKSSNNYTCWRRDYRNYGSEYTLLRKVINRNSYEYYLCFNPQNTIHKIDPYHQMLGNHVRIMYVLRQMEDNAVRAYFSKDNEFVKLKLNARIPKDELFALESFCWPSEKYSNDLEWIIRFDIWNYIKNKLLSLGVDIKEDLHG